MSLCYICGTGLGDEAECPKCRYPIQVLRLIDKACHRQRFLFGASKPESPSGPVEKAEPRVRRRKTEAPPPRNFEANPIREVEFDPILAHNEEELEPQTQPAKSKSIAQVLFIYLIDLFLLSCLMGSVLGLLLLVSERGLIELMTFSFIPVLFVGGGFVFVYFGIFVYTMRKTLGEVIFSRIYEDNSHSG